MTALYDTIGTHYVNTRQPDHRITAQITEALGNATSVVNIGAGTGSYECRDRSVVALEPSMTMIRQRPQAAAPAIQGMAEALPFGDGVFDAALAILTIHHWTNRLQGLAEMRRVARRVVIFTWDQTVWESFWLVRDYLPIIATLDRQSAMPIDELVSALGGGKVIPVPIPHDCHDGFHGAFWRRPTAYLNPQVRAGISTYSRIPVAEQHAAFQQLAADLTSGSWEEHNKDLIQRNELDLGYRLIIAHE